MGGIKLLHIVMKHGLLPEYSGILCIETEHNPDTQLVQTFQGFRIIRILILLMEGMFQQYRENLRRSIFTLFIAILF